MRFPPGFIVIWLLFRPFMNFWPCARASFWSFDQIRQRLAKEAQMCEKRGKG